MATHDNSLRVTLVKGRVKISNLRNKYGNFLFKVLSAIGDQAFFSGSNFIINLLLARWMIPEEYGVVVVAFTWFLLIQIFYEALVVAPMSFYGSDKYQNVFQRYLGYIFTAHAFMSLIIAAFFGIAAVLVTRFNSVLLGQAMAGIAVASIFLLARGMIRQPFYIISKPQLSALGGVIYLIVNIVTTVILHQMEILNPFSALVGMGVASFVTVVLQVYMLKPKFRGTHEGVTPRSILTDHWSYGKWALSAQSISWLSTYFGTLIIPLVTGFSGSAALRATMNFIMPVIMMNTALVALLTPMFVRTYKAEGAEGLSKKVNSARLMVMVVTGIYFLILAFFGKQLLSLFYQGKYDSEVSTLYMVVLAALPFVTTTSRILDAALMSMGKIKLSFKSKVIPTICTVLLDIILVVPFGILGIAIESLITASMTQYNVHRYYKRKLKEDAEAAQRSEHVQTTSTQETSDSDAESLVHSQNISNVAGDKKMISVIMPAYNAEKFIGEAIQSILDQTFKQFELIIVDDGSTDNTIKIIQSYCERDPRVTFIQNEHGGACKARNTAIEAAQYEWIAAMDADDIALPNRLERLLEAAQAEPDVIVWGSHQYQVNLEGKIIGKIQVGPKSKEEFYKIDRTRSVISVVNPTAMFKREIAVKVGGYNERLTAAQEIELWDRMAEFGPMRVIPEFLMKYRFHDESISAKRFHEQRMFHTYVLERNRAKLEGKELDLDEFIQDYKTRPAMERLFRYMHNSGRAYYRNTGILLSKKKYIQAGLSLMISFILSPKFSYQRTMNRLAG